MLKKQFREFLQTIGYEDDISDELLEELVTQMSKVLEFDNVGNSINFKTGCLIHQLVLKNQIRIRESLADQLRAGNFSPKLPPLQFSMIRVCLNLTEDNHCKVMQGWEIENTLCAFIEKKNFEACEIVQQSVDQGLRDWT